MSIPLRVLLVEDNEDDAWLLLRELRRHGYEPIYQRVETAAQLRAALAPDAWDVVTIDYTLPTMTGLDALAILKESALDLPIIMASGTLREEDAVQALRLGAHDFVVKGNLARLVPAIERELQDAKTRRERKQAETRLRAAEEKYRAIFDGSQDGIFQSTPGGRYLLANPAMARLLGYDSPDQLVASVTDIENQVYLEPERRAEFKRLMAERGRVTDFEYPVRRKDGSVIWISERAQVTALCYEGTVRDITARKQSEEQIQRQLQRLAALRAIDTAISSSLDLPLTLRFVLDQVMSQLGVDAGNILLLNPHLMNLEHAAARGFRGNGIRNLHLPLGKGIAGRVALERQLVSIPDLAAAGEMFKRPPLAQESFRAYFAAPLGAKGQIKGVLEVFHRSPLQPDPEWLNFLETLAGQTAIAIDNANLFTDLQKSNSELVLAYDATIEGWSRAMDLRDKETEGHTQRVTEMTLRLAQAMAFNGTELVHVRRGALLHDIGKMGVPDRILLKPDKLTDEEWVVMRQHPQFAFEMLSPIIYLKPALDIPYCHHEKWDGTGYPRGLKGEQIPLVARLFAAVDIWDALRSDRPYRAAWHADKVREYIQSLSGAHLDPKVVELFLREVADG